MAVQLDFGGFDPGFIGISVRFGNSRVWNLANSFTKSNTLLPVSRLSPDERFEALSAFTAMQHETRHFHDFFLSPYSARIFRLRVQYLWNMLELLPHVLRNDCNCVLVPISKWARMDTTKRSEQIDSLPPRLDGALWKPIPIPYFPDPIDPSSVRSGFTNSNQDPVEVLLRACCVLRDRIRDLTINESAIAKNVSFQPWQVFELSGVLVQHAQIWSMYGVDEANFFINYLLSQKNSPYAQVLFLATSVWQDRRLPIDYALVSAMVYWSLLGSYEKDKWRACPSVRFASLWALLSNVGVPTAPPANLMTLFDDWSARLQTSRVNEGIEETRSLQLRLSQDVDKCHTVHPSEFAATSTGGAITRVVNGVKQASDRLTATFQREPWTYVAPYLYDQSITEYPNPVFRQQFDNSVLTLGLSETQLAEHGYHIQWAVANANDPKILSLIKPLALSQHNYFSPDDVSRLDDFFSICDFLFDESVARVKTDIQRPGREFFKDAHVRPIEILD